MLFIRFYSLELQPRADHPPQPTIVFLGWNADTLVACVVSFLVRKVSRLAIRNLSRQLSRRMFSDREETQSAPRFDVAMALCCRVSQGTPRRSEATTRAPMLFIRFPLLPQSKPRAKSTRQRARILSQVLDGDHHQAASFDTVKKPL